MTNPENGPLAIIFAIFTLIALPAQIRARSISTISLALWLFVTGLTRGINAVIWSDNVEIKLKVWCDITTKIAVGFTYAVPGAAFCIMRQLESIASTRSVGTTIEDRRKRMILEITTCWIIPFILMAVHYVVQGHRYDLWEGMGCTPAFYNSIPTVFVVYVPPLAYSVASVVYGMMVVRHFVGHRIRFMTYLKTCPSSISVSRYVRLLCLASIEVFWEFAANIYILWYNVHLGLEPYVNWAFVHFDFSRVQQYPRFFFTNEIFNSIQFMWYIPSIGCIVFFLIFGTGEEAVKDYRAVIRWVWVKILRQTVSDKDRRSQFGSLPTHSTSSRGVATTVSQMYHDKLGKDGRKPWEDIEIKIPNLDEPSSPSYFDESSLYTNNSEAIAVTITAVSDTGTEGSRTNRNSTASTPADVQLPEPAPAHLAPFRFASAGPNGVRVTVEKDVV